MLSGVNAYQQQVQQLQQAQVQQPARQTEELKAREREKDGTVITRTRTESASKANAAETTREDRRQVAVNDRPTQAGGKESAQRRGSVLDITA